MKMLGIDMPPDHSLRKRKFKEIDINQEIPY